MLTSVMMMNQSVFMRIRENIQQNFSQNAFGPHGFWPEIIDRFKGSRGFKFHVYFSHLGVCFNHPDLLLANGTRPHHIFVLVIRLM